jgi:hypothetical protein
VPQRRVGHHRPEVGAADPDVDNRPDPFSCVAKPFCGADAIAEGGHPVEDVVDAGHHVLAVELERLRPRGPQGDMEHGPVFRGVDPRAGEHQVDPLAKPAGSGELRQQRQRAVAEPLLGMIHEQPAGLE